MSGICGVWLKEGPERTRQTLSAVSTGLSLHAAEQVSIETDDRAGIGLSARFNTQQLYRDSAVIVSCDADLYNETELAELVDPKPAGTAALMAAMYQSFGATFIDKLQGGFALILYDSRTKMLLAAIDGFGIKRLAYHSRSCGLVIASRIEAVMRSGIVPTDINPRAIANVLNFSANLGPQTIFKGVHRLAPGTLLTASDSRVRVEQYWDLRYYSGGDANEARLSRELEAVVQNSVATHCKGDTHIGAFLSGGTDSSTVVGMMSRTQQGPAKAFSIGYKEQSFNELSYAELAAKHFKANHYTHLVGPDDCFEALPSMIRYFDEPFGNSSAIPTYFCSKLAAEHGVKALLAGDGGDELFGGNERYATENIFEFYNSVPGVLRRGLIEPVLDRIPVNAGLFRRARGYVRRAKMPGAQRLLSFQFLSTHPLGDVFHSDFLKELGDYSIIDTPDRYYYAASARDHLDRLLYVDMKITLADNDLPKVTCMAELAGIEVRFPFLHRPVAEFSGRIPARLKVKGLEKRYLFKQAFRNLLPPEIIQKKKHGFGIPVAPWLKSDRRLRELSHDVLLSSRAFERGYFRRDFIENLFRQHETEDSTYYGDTLWTFLVLEMWHRQAVDEPVGIAV